MPAAFLTYFTSDNVFILHRGTSFVLSRRRDSSVASRRRTRLVTDMDSVFSVGQRTGLSHSMRTNFLKSWASLFLCSQDLPSLTGDPTNWSGWDGLECYPSILSPNSFPNGNIYISHKSRLCYLQNLYCFFSNPSVAAPTFLNWYLRDFDLLRVIMQLWRQLRVSQVTWLF